MKAPLGKYRKAIRTGAVAGSAALPKREFAALMGSMASSKGSPKATPAPRRKVRRDRRLDLTAMGGPQSFLVIPMGERITHHNGFKQLRNPKLAIFERLHAVLHHAQIY